LSISGYSVHLSEITKKEMEAASETLKEKMTRVTQDFRILPITEEAENLADEYIKEGYFLKDTMLLILESVLSIGKINKKKASNTKELK
jgi:hypothetical protein